jgi:O-antigen ligase
MVTWNKLPIMSGNLKFNRLENLVLFTILFAVLFVNPIGNLDPVNAPKFLVLMAGSFGVFGYLLGMYRHTFLKLNVQILYFSAIFVIWLILVTIFSGAPLEQQLFGTYGRNTGLFTYLALLMLYLGCSVISNKEFEKKFLKIIVIIFSVNLAFSFIQYLNLDPFNWAKLYSPIIGTFGNPNFLSAFLGMGTAMAGSYLLNTQESMRIRITSVIYILLSSILIWLSDSQQGFIVSFSVLAVVIYFKLRTTIKRKSIVYSYLSMVLVSSSLIISGFLQFGPLARILYQPSITYRGDYWRAGFKMMQEHWLFGVGIDSYGDWYRHYRTAEAVLRRGPSAVTDAAHNVFVDFGSTMGFVGLILYLFFVIFVLRVSIKYLSSCSKFDPFVVGIFAMWVGYIIQSILSINFIGLAIWGWILPGLLTARIYFHETSFSNLRIRQSEAKKAFKTQSHSFAGLISTIGFIFGGVIGFIPFNADANFRHALFSADSNKIQVAALKWPKDTSRMLYAVKVFDENELVDISSNLARKTIAFNPNSFNAWYYLYNSGVLNEKERETALKTLIRLDPNNKEIE